MPHVIEAAATGRAKCRGCGGKIAALELRFGERLPNPFADGETTHWFHLDCAAFKRPEPFLEALAEREEPLDGPGAPGVGGEARRGPPAPPPDRRRRAGAVRPGQCRSCREPIGKDVWRIRLVFYEDGRFVPSGYVHARCSRAYFETTDVLPRLQRFAPDLRDEDLKEIRQELEGPASA